MIFCVFDIVLAVFSVKYHNNFIFCQGTSFDLCVAAGDDDDEFADDDLEEMPY